MTNVGLIIIAFGFVFLNGFFVAAEFAMVKLRHTRVQTLKATKGWRGTILARVHNQLDAYLSACQLGITLASLGLGWIGEPAFAHILTPFLSFLGMASVKMVELVSFILAFSIISFLHIVVGELMPKSMAIRQAEKLSLWTAGPLYGFYWLMYPAIYLLNASANMLLKWFELDVTHDGENTYSSDELKLILQSSHLHGELKQAEAEIIEHTLEFADLQVSDVMRPVEELIALDNTVPLAENLDRIASYRYSRYPVYATDINQMIGIVHAKDLFVAKQRGEEPLNLNIIMRPLIKITPTCSTLELLQQFREGMTHMSLVYQRERLIGFVTLDNLLQVLIGRIKDEFHFSHKDWIKLKDGGFRIKGNTPIYTLEQLFDIDLSDYPENTLSGLLFHQLERFPEVNERVDFEQFYVIVEHIEGPKIKQIRIYRKSSLSEKN